MVRHIAAEWRHRNVPLCNSVIISALNRISIEVLFTNPEVRFAARVNVFSDYGSSVLDSLPRYFNAFDLAGRQVDIQQQTNRRADESQV